MSFQPDDRGIISSVMCPDCKDGRTDHAVDECTEKVQLLNQPSNGLLSKKSPYQLFPGSSHPVKTFPSTAESPCLTCGAYVLRVIRRGGEAVHYVDKPLEVGKLS